MQSDDDLLLLLLLFAPLSLMAFGGGNSIIAVMQSQVVDVHRWMGGAAFLVLFAISRGAPGPGTMMLATLIGWTVAGFAGAVVTTLAMFVPSSVFCIGAAALLRRFQGRRVVALLEQATHPVGAGLIVGGIASLGQLTASSWTLLAIAVTSSIISILRPTVHPLLLVGGGAVINVLVVRFI